MLFTSIKWLKSPFLNQKYGLKKTLKVEYSWKKSDSKASCLEGGRKYWKNKRKLERSKLGYNVHNMIMLAYYFARILVPHVMNGLN